MWRRRTRNRLVIWFATNAVVLFSAGPIVDLLVTSLQAALSRYGSLFSLGGALVFMFVFGYYGFGVARALRSFGDGGRIAPVELLVGLAGIIGSLVGMVIFANVNLART